MRILDGKIAVVTGGTRGFGLAIAKAFAQEGACVVVASRSDEAINHALAQIVSNGNEAKGLTCDVGELDQVKALANFTIQHYGRFDLWVNNAGISAPYGPTGDIPIKEFQKVLQTNISGTYFGSWIALHHFLNTDNSKRPFPGKLINVLGRGANQPVPMQNAYASSKTWIRNFTLALAKEYQERKLGIYAYNPGLMYTDLMSEVEVINGYEEKIKPLRTVMRLWANPPELPAQKMVWLASSATDDRTGLELKELSLGQTIKGILQEGLRQITRQSAPNWEIEIDSIPPANEQMGQD
jgi:glucose 1-dehydrogenase